jgi:hypothetical protein
MVVGIAAVRKMPLLQSHGPLPSTLSDPDAPAPSDRITLPLPAVVDDDDGTITTD